MFISDIQRQFFEFIAGKHVLILVHYDLDAICASKILQTVLKTDNILYTLCPVLTQTELQKVISSHIEQVEIIVLINCGGTLDLVELLQLPPKVTVFIADTHRPLHVCNIYSESQVRVLSSLEDDEEVPSFADVFRDEENSDSEEEEESGVTEERLEKRRERRLWEQKRTKLLFDYSQYSYHAGSSASLMYDLAWRLSKDDNDLLWYSIIGLSSEILLEKREAHRLTLASANFNSHVARLQHANNAAIESGDCSDNIAFQKDLQLSLYRHWSLVESLKHSRYTATVLKLWTHKGEKRMYELLADLGLPLTECRQLYCGMDINLRNELATLLDSKASKYGLEKLVIPSFTRTHVFHSRICAMDYVHSALALLEPANKEGSKADAFFNAANCMSDTSQFTAGVTKAKQQLEAIYSQMHTFLDMNQVISAGPFLYATVLQGSPLSHFFSGVHTLSMLGRFTLHAHVAVCKSKKARSLPLVLVTPLVNGEDDKSWCLICGIPPVADHSHKNFFGKAFEQAVEKTQSKAELDFFDNNVVKLWAEDRNKFFDALISLLS